MGASTLQSVGHVGGDGVTFAFDELQVVFQGIAPRFRSFLELIDLVEAEDPLQDDAAILGRRLKELRELTLRQKNGRREGIESKTEQLNHTGGDDSLAREFVA